MPDFPRYVLCFDCGSGGVSAARFDEELNMSGYQEIPWVMPLTREPLEREFDALLKSVCGAQRPAAISISTFMHSFAVMDPERRADLKLYTWMDDAPESSVRSVRRMFGDDFHRRTGCHYHAMFPIFKLASMTVGEKCRIVSPKTMLIERLTGNVVEDIGMAAASGLMNVETAEWDEKILQTLKLESANLPSLCNPDEIVGKFDGDIPVVSGSGDGFMANVGSGCETPRRMAITLGTSGAVRQMVMTPALDPQVGTFCYRARRDSAFLLGCATSNGGNALDWARQEFGGVPERKVKREIPIFLPWLKGERSLEWDPQLRPQWWDRKTDHTNQELLRSVMEGVVFNLAQYVEVIERQSGMRADEFVLSGNGFLDPAIAPLLAKAVGREMLLPEASGLGTLRGAAINAWRGLGHDARPAVEKLLDRAAHVIPDEDEGIPDRFERFKALRLKGPS